MEEVCGQGLEDARITYHGLKLNHLATFHNKNTWKCSLAACESTKKRDPIW